MPKRTLIGTVTSDKMSKTRVVETARVKRHAKYGKLIHDRTVCYAHDENNESHLGDVVEIVESQPMSRTKRWQLVRIVARRAAAEVAAGDVASQLEAAEVSVQPPTAPASLPPGA
jgi:small subunit ribosomal protein S17